MTSRILGRAGTARLAGAELILAGTAALAPVAAVAQTPPAVWGPAAAEARTDLVTARVVPAVAAVRPGRPFLAAVRLSIEPGWYLYWTNPGETGLATTVAWEGPPGFRSGPIRWPPPRRRVVDGLVTHTLAGEVLLIATLSPPPDARPGTTTVFTVTLGWGVCRDVCIPEQLRLTLAMPVASEPPGQHPRWPTATAGRLDALPRAFPDWSLSARLDEGTLVLSIEPPSGRTVPPGPMTFYPAAPGVPAARAAPRSHGTGERRRGGPIVEGRRGAAHEHASEAVHLRLEPDAVEPGHRLRGILVASAGWDAAGRHHALVVDLPVADQGRPTLDSLEIPE